MVQDSGREEQELTEEILNFCRHVAGSYETAAACTCGHYTSWLTTGKMVVQVLLIIRDFPPRLMNYAKTLGSRNLSVIAVDRWVFERDVDRGFLGEALAGELIFPYSPLVNKEYLHVQEIRLKKRLVVELLQSLIMDFPELSYEFYIEPIYFVHEAMMTRARLFPPMLYALRTFFKENGEGHKGNGTSQGFSEALRELEEENVVYFWKDYVRICKDFADGARSRKYRFANLFKTGQRALFTSLLSVFPQVLNALFQSRRSFVDFQRLILENTKAGSPIEDPESHVYVRTVSGFAPLANRMDIQVFARKVLAAGEDAQVEIRNIGGILNDVYLVSVDGGRKRAVVKRFRDWSNFKWFPLTLWSLGTRTFSVLGRSRLEKECAINQLLQSKGFRVPRVLHVSPTERLVFMEYVEGEDMSRVIRRVAGSKRSGELRKDLELIERTGELFARVHALGVALGDTKPENILVGDKSEIYMTDFEQASRNGDKVWDVAEFLYYAGHDVSPFVSSSRLEAIAKAFIKGYLRSGGNARTVKSAANPKYTKVFSVFTFPHIMIALSNICRKAEKLEK